MAQQSTLDKARKPIRSLAQHDVIIAKPLLLYYIQAVKTTKHELRSAWQDEVVLALRPSGKSQSTELWILLTSSHAQSRECVPSTMRTCLLTPCAPALPLMCSGVPLVCIGLPPSVQLTSIITFFIPHGPCVRPRLRLEGRVGSARNHTSSQA